jgi:hypothetical protein
VAGENVGDDGPLDREGCSDVTRLEGADYCLRHAEIGERLL